MVSLLSTLLTVLVLSHSALAREQFVLSPSSSREQTEDVYGTNITSAQHNANKIFNAVHSSLRQWGSSIEHNGVSFFPATVPSGTVLYHGTWDPEIPRSFEWLAFEVQHAEMFARSMRMAPRGGYFEDRGFGMYGEEFRGEGWTGGGGIGDRDEEEETAGYLHTYQANRELKVLFIDGMSAAKCPKGSMESQDIVIGRTIHYWNEEERATGLCEAAREWGLDAFVRMETGFELIYCNFTSGLDLLSVNRKPVPGSAESLHQWTLFEYVREASKRYMGNFGGRLKLDYSRMVSAFFYPANLTNAQGGAKYPRISSAGPEQIARIREDLGEVMMRGEVTTTDTSSESIDWQGVVDMVVARYSDRLLYMASGELTHQGFLGVVNNLLNMYGDYNQTTEAEVMLGKCAEHYLLPISPRARSDELIYAAVSTVLQEICGTLFAVREKLLVVERENPTGHEGDHERYWGAGGEGKEEKGPLEMVRELNAWLDWTDWKLCPTCPLDEVCFVAMFPYGTKEDHESPMCKNSSEVERGSRQEVNYWRY